MIPEGWVACQLGGVAKFIMGQAPLGKLCNKDGVGTPFVKAGEFSSKFPVIREWTTSPLKFAQKGDVLICVVGATAGKLNHGIDCAIGRSVAAIRALESLDSSYLYNLLLPVVDRLRRGSSGSAQGVITIKHLSDVDVLLPPLPEQKKIASILTSVDEAIEMQQAQISKLQDLKKAMMQELLTKGIGHTEFKDSLVGRIPVGWEVKKITDFLECYRGGAALRPADFSEEGHQVIPKKAVQYGGQLIIDKPRYCTNDFAKANKNNWVDDTYLITTLRDLVPTGPSIGLIAKVMKAQEYILAQGVYGFRLADGLNSEYLVQISNSQWYRGIMQRILVGSTQVHIRTQEFFDVLIPYPPVEEQEKIARMLTEIDENARVKAIKKQKMILLKRSLMQDLLTGKVRVNVQ